MALDHITEAEMDAAGVVSAPDILTGTPAQNKAVFDNLVRAVVAAAVNQVIDELNAHETDTTNPHAVTAEQVGLGRVDNTADADKPVSTAQADALALKADKTNVLEKDNAAAFTPADDYQPATKKYTDDTVTGVVLGQIPDGSLTEEKLAPGVQDKLTFDTEPEEGSEKAVSSGGTFTAIAREINNCVKTSEKATEEEATAGIDDTKWMTPAKTKLSLGNGNELGTVQITTRTDLGDKWLLCNGDKIDSENYPDLALAVNNDIIGAWDVLSTDRTAGEYQDSFKKMCSGNGYVAFVYSSAPGGGFAVVAYKQLNTPSSTAFTYKSVGLYTISFICYKNGYFVCGGTNASGYPTIAYTQDITGTWSIYTIGTDANLKIIDLDYDGTYYVALMLNGSTSYLYYHPYLMSLEGNVKNIGSVIYPWRLFCAGDSKYYITGYSLSGSSRPMIVYLASGLTGGYYSTIVGTDSGESVCIERIDGDLYLISREMQTENYVPCVTIRKIVQQSASVAVFSAPITLHSDPNIMSNRVIDAYVVGDFLYVQAGDGTLLKVNKLLNLVSKINLAVIANLSTDSVFGLCITETEFYAWLAKTNVIVLIKKATIPAISPTGAFAYIKAKD